VILWVKPTQPTPGARGALVSAGKRLVCNVCNTVFRSCCARCRLQGFQKSRGRVGAPAAKGRAACGGMPFAILHRSRPYDKPCTACKPKPKPKGRGLIPRFVVKTCGLPCDLLHVSDGRAVHVLQINQRFVAADEQGASCVAACGCGG